MESNKDRNQARTNERDNDRYTERHDHCPGPPAGGAEEVEQLRIKAEVYRKDFIFEHKQRQQAEAKVRELEAKLEEAKGKEQAYASELDDLNDKLEQTVEEKNNILSMMRKLKRELNLHKEQTGHLQENLRQLEKERRMLRFGPQVRDQQGRALPWSCPRCTLDNEATTTRCGVCEEPKPVTAGSADLSLGGVVCDSPIYYDL